MLPDRLIGFHKLVYTHSALSKINPTIILAIITVESNWNPKAIRYEPKYVCLTKEKEFALKLGITLDTERTLQRFSMGLMQIMAGTARGLGYEGMIMDLLDPETNIIWGIEYFKKNCADYVNVNDQIAAYNAGSVKKMGDGSYYNQGYVDKVNQALKYWTYLS